MRSTATVTSKSPRARSAWAVQIQAWTTPLMLAITIVAAVESRFSLDPTNPVVILHQWLAQSQTRTYASLTLIVAGLAALHCLYDYLFDGDRWLSLMAFLLVCNALSGVTIFAMMHYGGDSWQLGHSATTAVLNGSNASWGALDRSIYQFAWLMLCTSPLLAIVAAAEVCADRRESTGGDVK